MEEQPALDAAIQHLKNATQALWDAREKSDLTKDEANFLAPIATAAVQLTATAIAAKHFLETRRT